MRFQGGKAMPIPSLSKQLIATRLRLSSVEEDYAHPTSCTMKSRLAQASLKYDNRIGLQNPSRSFH